MRVFVYRRRRLRKPLTARWPLWVIQGDFALLYPASNFQGALIVGVFIDSPADFAGLRAGDIVVAVNGEPVVNVREILDKVSDYQPGEIIDVSVFRGPQQLDFRMKATDRPQM